MKQCTKCNESKGLDSFHKGNSKDGLSYWCKDCSRNYSLNRYIKSSREVLSAEQKREKKRIAKQNQRAGWTVERREMEKVSKRLRRYNIDLERYRSLYSNSDSRCYACNRPESEVGTLNIDHDHGCCNGRVSCGDCVRGLLCSECNTSLGLMHESTDRIVGLMSYAIQYRRTGALGDHASARMDYNASCMTLNKYASVNGVRLSETHQRPQSGSVLLLMGCQGQTSEAVCMETKNHAWTLHNMHSVMHTNGRKCAHTHYNRKELN